MEPLQFNLYEKAYGFQVALVMCGNVVNQDGSLGKVFTSNDADKVRDPMTIGCRV